MSLRFLKSYVLCIHDPELAKEMYNNLEAFPKFGWMESMPAYSLLRKLIGSNIHNCNGESWKRQRRIAGPAFHRTRVREFARDMVRTGREMTERWAAIPDGRIEMSEEMARVTAEIVTRAMFSDDLGPGRAQTVFEAFSRYQEGLGKLDLVEMTGLPRWLPRLGAAKARRAVAQLDKVMESIIDARQSDGPPSEPDADQSDPQTGSQ